MKNSPEPNDFRELENRLRNYSEQPDDSVWTNIANGIKPPQDIRGAVWRDWTAAVAMAIFLSWTIAGSTRQPGHSNAVSEILPAGSVTANRLAEHSGAREIERSSPAPKEPSAAGTQAIENFTAGNDQHPAVKTSHAVAVGKSNETPAGASPPAAETAETPGTRFLTSTLAAKPADADSVKNDSTESNTQKTRSGLPARKMDLPRHSTERKNLTFYGLLTPSLSFFSATPKSRDNIVVQSFENPSIFSSDRFGVNLEGGLQGKLTEKLNYTAGLSLYYQSQTLRFTGTYPEGSSLEDLGDFTYILSPGVFRKSINYTMLNAGIQGGLLYTLKDHLLKHQIGMVGQYQKGLYHSSNTESYDNASSQYVYLQAVYRVEFKGSSRINYFIQPTVGTSVWSDEGLQAPFTLKGYRAGIGFGFTYLLHPAQKLKTLAPNQSNR